MPFKDTKEGQTHHDGDACLKCEVCKAHFFRDIISQHVCVTKETLKEWAEEAKLAQLKQWYPGVN
jgi:hypothetical protein